MIGQDELETVIGTARKYGVGKLYLIGSLLHKTTSEADDYDFAVKDVPDGNFFKFYTELFMSLPKNVDLIDLSGETTKFKQIIMEEGMLIYEGSKD